MEQTSFVTSKCETQSGKKKKKKKIAPSMCRILHTLSMQAKLLKKRARKTSIIQADFKVTFHTVTSLILRLSRAISRVWPVDT